ncbi:MAG TPA: hypothetical protein VGL82_11295, partial [Bryobacteraceae bacterium]
SCSTTAIDGRPADRSIWATRNDCDGARPAMGIIRHGKISALALDGSSKTGRPAPSKLQQPVTGVGIPQAAEGKPAAPVPLSAHTGNSGQRRGSQNAHATEVTAQRIG